MAWQDEWKNNITTMEELRKVIPMTDEEYALIGEEAGKFPMSISRYYASLIDPSDPDDPIRKMSVPSRSGLSLDGELDTSGEHSNTVLQGIQHKYRQTALVLMTTQCAMYCRYCFRRRLVGLDLEKPADDLPDSEFITIRFIAQDIGELQDQFDHTDPAGSIGPDMENGKALAAKDIHMMTMLSAALCQQQIIITILLIDMGPLWISTAKAYAQIMDFTSLLTSLHIDLANFDFALFPQKIALAVVEEQRGVATAHTEVDIDRVRPFTIGIVGINIEMLARGKHRRHHIETALVVTDGGGIDARLLIHPLDSDLRIASETSTHLLPMNQVLAMEDRHARIILECAVHQIEVITGPTHGGIGMKTWQYRIAKPLCPATHSQHHDCYDNK